MVTREELSGQGMDPTGFPTYGEFSGSVISTRFALPCRKVNSRTMSPTVTASSTRADMMRGVDTFTSTPHASLNNHSLLGWFTRATVRGTANSVFASRDVTRLTLSSPVAAMTTSHDSSLASSSEDSSQESASSHSASGTRSGFSETGSLSMSSTRWPLPISSRATDRPTAPAPAIATLIGWGSPEVADQGSGSSARGPARRRSEGDAQHRRVDENAAGRDAGSRESGNLRRGSSIVLRSVVEDLVDMVGVLLAHDQVQQ